MGKSFGNRALKGSSEWQSMFEPETGIGTGMEVDEAFAIVLERAREQAGEVQQAVGVHSEEYNEVVEALGLIEKVRYLIEEGE